MTDTDILYMAALEKRLETAEAENTELKARVAELEDKHWNECRQIAHYDNDIKSLKAQIADLKRCVKSLNSDYLTGYISALSAVERIIDKSGGTDDENSK